MKAGIKNIFSFCILSIVLGGNAIISQEIGFNHLSTRNGLSNNIIVSLYIDQRGFLWIGTEGGLSRYNGYTIKNYIYNPYDSTSLCGATVTGIIEDKKGSLLIASKNGVCIYDYKTESFRTIFDAEKNNSFNRNFYKSKSNEVILVNTKGLYFFDSEKQLFTKYFHSSIDEAASCVSEDNKGNLIIGTWGNGLLVVGQDTSIYERKLASKQTKSQEANVYEAITRDKDGQVWIADQNGLNRCTVINKNKHLMLELIPEKSLILSQSNKPNSTIHSLITTRKGEIWIGTEFGLHIYNPDTRKVQNIYADTKSSQSLSNNHISTMLLSKSDEVWLGTYQGGVNQYSPTYQRFIDEFPGINKSDNTLIRYVKAVYQDKEGDIWIGSDYGLSHYGKDYRLKEQFIHSAKPGSLPVGGVSAIISDDENNLYVGLWGGGLCRYDRKDHKFISYSYYNYVNMSDPHYSGDVNVRAFAQASNGNIWVAHMFGIVDLFNPATGLFKHFNLAQAIRRPNLVIRSMVIDAYGNLWIASTGAGLIKYSARDEKFQLYSPASGSDIRRATSEIFAVYIDGSGKIWLGTGSGLASFNPINEEFIWFDHGPGVLSEPITSITGDKKGHIWAGTLQGISSFVTDSAMILSFDEKDGVIANSEVAYKSSDGKLYFSGVNGITSFSPESIWSNKAIPPIVFTDFKLFNQSVPAGSKILPNTINETGEIVLKHDQNVFSIQVAALNFVQPEKNTYKFSLEGFDGKWVFLGSDREQKYTNLDPGVYYFKVKASNNDGIWNETGRVLKITILPPWWSTPFFRIIMVVAFLSLLFGIISLRTLQLKHQKDRLVLMVAVRTKEIEKQKAELLKQAQELSQVNLILVDKQEEIQIQKEAIELQNKRLETKNKQLEEQKQQVEEMSAKLHEADQMKLRFFTNVSHEIRTPLSLISGPLQKALQKSEEIANQLITNNLKLVSRNSHRLLRLINQLLDLSKIEANVLELKVSKESIVDFLAEIIESHKEICEHKEILLTFEQSVDPGNIIFDADKVEKITYNLLSNAIKFTPPGGSIKICLNIINQTEHSFPRLELIISDSGIGMSEENKHRIFERFYQIHASGEAQSGTGIGLALTKELIDIYRGSISVESTPGEGSTFRVLLPFIESEFTDHEMTSEKSHHATLFNESSPSLMDLNKQKVEIDKGSDNLQAKPLVLIVDDNEDTIAFIYDNLKNDYCVNYARDGESGYENAINNIPSLIICDVMMPKLNGFQLCAKLKNDERTCHVPIILLTAKTEKNDEEEGFLEGADEYVTKPYDIDLLKVKVASILENREKIKKKYFQKTSYNISDLEVDSSDEKLVKRIFKSLDDNLSNPDFGVNELSKDVGLSRMHLYRKVSGIINQSPVELIRNARLQRASNLLKQKKMYVSEVAYLSGFKELSYFRKIFKDYYGYSPTEFANKNLSSEN